MAKYPIKMLLDELKRPFFPLVTVDTIVTNNSDKTLMQLFEERYTKEEVDKLISDLGTLQRLRGTVNSYEELLAIEDPMPGDTYILLVEGGNNAEYMYIGDKWEALGPTASYTDVYSKEVVDEMLLALKQELNTKTELDDAEVLEQAKLYAEDLFANVPAPDMSEYYKKSETDAKIDEKINAIPVNDLLHYKGHVTSVDSLPSLGQPTGNPMAHNIIVKDSLNDVSIPLETMNTTPLLKYYICMCGLLLLETDYPELISIVVAHTQNGSTGKDKGGYIGYHIKYDPDKPVYLTFNRDANGGAKYNTYKKIDGTWTKTSSTPAYTAIPRTIVNNEADYIFVHEGSSGTYWYYWGSLTSGYNYSLEMKSNIQALPFKYVDLGMSNYILCDSIKLAYTDYYYNDGMKLFESDENGQLFFVKNVTTTQLNDVYTVGDNYDIYRRNARPEWEHWGKVEVEPGTGVVINRWEGVA